MQTDPRVIEVLNEILTAELTGVNQYFLHAKMCGNWGYRRLEKKIREESIEEMHHAEEVIERILYFGGHPNVQRLGSITIGESVPEQFRLDLEVERSAIERLNTAVALCVDCGDNGTRALLEHILVEEEEHADWIETQLGLIEQLGDAAYLSEQMGD